MVLRVIIKKDVRNIKLVENKFDFSQCENYKKWTNKLFEKFLVNKST
jgi:hypothetical protein